MPGWDNWAAGCSFSPSTFHVGDYTNEENSGLGVRFSVFAVQ